MLQTRNKKQKGNDVAALLIRQMKSNRSEVTSPEKWHLSFTQVATTTTPICISRGPETLALTDALEQSEKYNESSE